MQKLTDLGDRRKWRDIPAEYLHCLAKFPLHKLDAYYNAKEGIISYTCKKCAYVFSEKKIETE